MLKITNLYVKNQQTDEIPLKWDFDVLTFLKSNLQALQI